MMRRSWWRPFTVVALVVAAVRLVVILTRPARAIRRALGVTTATRTLWWWDPILQPFRAAYGALTSIVRSVTNIITGWITDLFNVLTSAVDDVANMVTTAFNAMSDLATGIWSAVTNITANLIPTLAYNIYNTVGSWVNTLRSDLSAGLADVRGLAGLLFDSARASAAALFNSIYGTVANWVDQVRTWVTTQVLPWVSRLVGDAVAPLRSLIDGAANAAASALDGLRRAVMPWVDLVRGAETWLRWFIAHPFDWWHGLLNDIAGLGARAFTEAFTRSIASEGDTVEQWLVGWLGGVAGALAFTGMV